ncbi:HAUS augmin-like complex subunit 2 [Pezoporus flaviventris]|uniref:HAUS augmin-like complex subunit 2 n=1 Tax=Pezoporus flaviventris TaxID=889875 RepID=UPI002AB00EF4|nr:HAUS augmin-like complex subunit 2 [Pezoporus flaviventris]
MNRPGSSAATLDADTRHPSPHVNSRDKKHSPPEGQQDPRRGTKPATTRCRPASPRLNPATAGRAGGTAGPNPALLTCTEPHDAGPRRRPLPHPAAGSASALPELPLQQPPRPPGTGRVSLPFPSASNMAAALRSLPPSSARASGTPTVVERRRSASSAMETVSRRPFKEAEPAREPLELSLRLCADGAGEQGDAAAARCPWEMGQSTVVSALLARCLAAGAVTQETLDLNCRPPLCSVKFAEMERMANMRAEINEMKLKTEILQLEKEAADITHPFYLGKKCEIMQDMNRHLEAILKEERALRKRLMKPRCQESLPIEATFHKDIVELLTEAVTFIGKLESHLQTIRSIPQIPNMVNNMETALTKTELLVIELEELTEHILKWRELQRTSNVICSTAELDFGLSVT